MIYQFKIHSTDRNKSVIGQVEADGIGEATTDAIAAYYQQNSTTEIIELTIENVVEMEARRAEWEKEGIR